MLNFDYPSYAPRVYPFYSIFGGMTVAPELHFKMYKPYGILCQMGSNDPRDIRNKRFLSEFYIFPTGTMPVGRLDEKSEGLLLLTTDGKLSDHINRFGIEKEYYAQLDGQITLEAIRLLTSGVEIGFSGKRYRTLACTAQKLDEAPALPNANPKIRLERHRHTSWIHIVLTEGKFRQVRKMTAAVGFPTLRLVRVRVGAIHLGDMEPGSVLSLYSLL